MTRLTDLILHFADNTIAAIADNTLPAGHNGPYHDIETPVRNTGHWLVTFAHAYYWTKEERYYRAAHQCATYLTSRVVRPQGYSFHHRNGKKDHCNGLVGQAWTFEALAEASRLFNDNKYDCLAEEVFFQHHFDEEIGLWNRLEIDGQILPHDTALNHQLWFAACAGMGNGKNKKEIRYRIKRFLDCLEKNVTSLHNGLIYHPVEHLFEKHLAKQFILSNRVKGVLKACYNALRGMAIQDVLKSEARIRKEIRDKLIYKSIGYHSFNMYAFAILKPQFPYHVFWESKKFKQMINYMKTTEFQSDLIDNKYSYAYNPPGFEVPYSRFVLEDLGLSHAVEITKDWVSGQIKHSFNKKTGLMDKNTEDPLTHMARVYEIARIPKEIAEKVEIIPHILSSGTYKSS